jgi:hypothetical protein
MQFIEEIRGQIGFPEPVRFVAKPVGSDVVPPVNTAAAGLGKFDVYDVGGAKFIAYTLTVTGMNGTSARIRTGVRGQNGTTVATLNGGPTTWNGQTGNLTAAQVDAIFKQGLYLDVTSAANPNGQIRAQIVQNPLVFGIGCVGTSGTLRIDSALNPNLGSAGFGIYLRGAKPGAAALLFLSLSNTTYLGQSLPVALSPNAPGCSIWIDAAQLIALPTMTNMLGCASIGIPIPNQQVLNGVSAYAQWAVADPGANALGIVTSDAICVTVE